MAAKKKTAKKTARKSSKKAAKKKTAKRAGGRPAAGTPTKADFIRAKLAEGMSAGDIVRVAAAEGMKISPPQVYKLKAKGAAKGGPGRPKAASAPKAGKPTASNFIRQHPDKSAGEIVKLGAAAGLKFGESSVYQTRAYDKRKGGAPKAKPGKKPAVKAAASNGITTFKKLALEIGFPKAREIVVELERKWNDLLA